MRTALDGIELLVWLVVAAIWLLGRRAAGKQASAPAQKHPPAGRSGELEPKPREDAFEQTFEADDFAETMERLREVVASVPVPTPVPVPQPVQPVAAKKVVVETKPRPASARPPAAAEPATAAELRRQAVPLFPAIGTQSAGPGLPAAEISGLLLNASGLRAAIVAREILGPPKAVRLEDAPV